MLQDGPAESAAAQHTSESILDASMSSNSEDLKRSSKQTASALDSIEQRPASPRDSRNRGRKGSVTGSVEESESLGNDDMDALLAGESCFLPFFWFKTSAFARFLYELRESLVFRVMKYAQNPAFTPGCTGLTEREDNLGKRAADSRRNSAGGVSQNSQRSGTKSNGGLSAGSKKSVTK